MKSFEFKLKTVTPLIMSGADQGKFELREMSIAGAMRYWYRKLYGSNEEIKIFGSTGRKGRFRIYVHNISSRRKKVKDYKKLRGRYPDTNYGRNYFISILRRDAEERTVLPENETFNLSMEILDEDFIKQVLGSFWAAVYIGGFGTRSRRGFGSLKVVNMNDNGSFVDHFIDIDETNLKRTVSFFGFSRDAFNIYMCDGFSGSDYKNHVRREISNYGNFEYINGNYRRYVENSRSSRITCPCSNALECLDLVGWTLSYFRSYLNPDYNEAKSTQKREIDSNKIYRSSFGLPINFYFSSIRKNTKVNGRASSRLIIRVYEKNGKYYPVLIFDKKGRKNPSNRNPDLLLVYLKFMEMSGFKKVIP